MVTRDEDFDAERVVLDSCRGSLHLHRARSPRVCQERDGARHTQISAWGLGTGSDESWGSLDQDEHGVAHGRHVRSRVPIASPSLVQLRSRPPVAKWCLGPMVRSYGTTLAESLSIVSTTMTPSNPR